MFCLLFVFINAYSSPVAFTKQYTNAKIVRNYNFTPAPEIECSLKTTAFKKGLGYPELEKFIIEKQKEKLLCLLESECKISYEDIADSCITDIKSNFDLKLPRKCSSMLKDQIKDQAREATFVARKAEELNNMFSCFELLSNDQQFLQKLSNIKSFINSTENPNIQRGFKNLTADYLSKMGSVVSRKDNLSEYKRFFITYSELCPDGLRPHQDPLLSLEFKMGDINFMYYNYNIKEKIERNQLLCNCAYLLSQPGYNHPKLQEFRVKVESYLKTCGY